MSIYLTIAMMLYGRSEDRLFHVLIDPEEFEYCKEFFHPFKKPRKLNFTDRSGKRMRLSTANVRIELGEIPFVKTGKHRRIRFSDLMLFKRQRDANRRRALDRLTEMSQELGLDAFRD